MTPESIERDGWNEWSKYVLKELERLNNCYEKLDGKVDLINSRVTNLYIKVAGIGAVSAILTTLVFSLLSTALKGKG